MMPLTGVFIGYWKYSVDGMTLGIGYGLICSLGLSLWASDGVGHLLNAIHGRIDWYIENEGDKPWLEIPAHCIYLLFRWRWSPKSEIGRKMYSTIWGGLRGLYMMPMWLGLYAMEYVSGNPDISFLICGLVVCLCEGLPYLIAGIRPSKYSVGIAEFLYFSAVLYPGLEYVI